MRPYHITNTTINGRNCDELIEYFRDNIARLGKNNENAYYNGRIIYFQDIDDLELKSDVKVYVDHIIDTFRSYWELDHQLYPDSIHIVKWPEGSELGEHADAYFADGTPNYSSYRTHSCVTFLNDEFGGGEFEFTKRETKITPETGYCIMFTAGLDDMHKVHKVTKGNRYTLACWFTDDESKAIQDWKEQKPHASCSYD